MGAEQGLGDPADVRVEVDRIDDLHVAPRGEAQQAARDPFQAAVEILPPVAGDQDQPLRRIRARQVPVDRRGAGRVGVQDADRIQQRVDHRVAGDHDARGVDAFAQQVVARLGGRREVQVGEHGGEPAVHFLRPGGVDVAGAQSGFDVADGDFGVERGQRGGEGRGRVALHQHAVGPEVGIHLAQPFEHRGRDVGQPLAVPHHVKVAVRADGEQVQHLIQHLPVLRGDADERRDAGGFGEAADDRRHLDGLGAGADDG